MKQLVQGEKRPWRFVKKCGLRASSESILSQLGMENTKANSDAVRILSYNNIDITKTILSRLSRLRRH